MKATPPLDVAVHQWGLRRSNICCVNTMILMSDAGSTSSDLLKPQC
jgi:hypothetical protein